MRVVATTTALLIGVASAAGCMGVQDDVGSVQAAVGSVVPCEVAGYGSYPSGDSFDGTANSVTPSLNWTHSQGADTFETTSATPGSVTCLQNGLLQALFIGEGQGVLNGVSGYYYQIQMTDNRPAPTPGEDILLNARRDFRPSGWTDGEASFATPTDVVVPETVTVTAGDPARQWAFLYFDGLRCKYRGDGTNYVFDKCPDDRSVAPGDTLSVESARLHLQNGRCGDDGVLEATAYLGSTPSTPAPGARDTYFIAVIDSLGNTVLEYSDPLDDGDIDIHVL